MDKKIWLVEEHQDGTYSILEPNPEAGMPGVCYAGKYFGVVTSDNKEDAYLISANELCRLCGKNCEPYKCAPHMKRKDNIIPHKCDRCGGRWFHERDSHGSYLACMRCGNHFTLTMESGVYSGTALTSSYYGNKADRVSWSGFATTMEAF